MLKDLLAQKQTAIWESWRERIFSSYPEKSGKFFARQKDRFANPIGQTVSDATEAIVKALVSGTPATDEEVTAHLERVIKIRSIQDFSPSEAVSFVYDLRDVLRQTLRSDLERSAGLRAELRSLEDEALTQLVLRSFEIYVACRERLYNVRVNELKRSVYTMRRRFANPEIEDPFHDKGDLDAGKPDAQSAPDGDDEGESN